MNTALGLLALAVAVVTVTALAERARVSAPLVLVVVGITASFVPFVHEPQLTADVILYGFLPPLLYAAALKTSVLEFRANLRSIALLSVLLVIFTAVGVGWLSWLVLPIPFAAAVALGAVVSPPDAIAATSIARRVGLPRRIVTILEGESLLNDATAITCLNVALLGLAGSLGWWQGAVFFAFAAVGGVVVGYVVALVAVQIRARVTEPLLDNAISLIVPFAAYLPAELLKVGEFHASGVIAVVVAGLILGHKAPLIQTAQSRLSERINWGTIQFLLENAVFLLIGLQARHLLTDIVATGLRFGTVIGFCLAVLGAVIVLRLAWMAVSRVLLFYRTDQGVQRKSWAAMMVIGWAGMRGVVTLAVAFLLPPQTPYRSLLVFAALVVTAGTLLLQGLTLPLLARRVGLQGPDPREDALQAATVLQQAAGVALHTLETGRRSTDSDEAVSAVRDRINNRVRGVWETLGAAREEETPSEEYRRLRLDTLQAERQEILRVRSGGKIDHDVIQQVLGTLDIEESMLTRLDNLSEDIRSETLTNPIPIEACEHLDEAPTVIRPVGPGVCLDCEREATRPVHLRLCLTCGNVGCCESSVGNHATRHFQASDHPVMRSFEQGEAWRWCYVDDLIG